MSYNTHIVKCGYAVQMKNENLFFFAHILRSIKLLDLDKMNF